MGFWFDKKDTFENHTEPYKPSVTTEDMNRMAFSKDFQAELYNDHKVLSNLQSMLFTMILSCRKNKSKKMVVSEEDLLLLYKITRKEIQVKR